eukprot:2224022-Alexandrium_andersonii.AAC.1
MSSECAIGVTVCVLEWVCRAWCHVSCRVRASQLFPGSFGLPRKGDPRWCARSGISMSEGPRWCEQYDSSL